MYITWLGHSPKRKASILNLEPEDLEQPRKTEGRDKQEGQTLPQRKTQTDKTLLARKTKNNRRPF